MDSRLKNRPSEIAEGRRTGRSLGRLKASPLTITTLLFCVLAFQAPAPEPVSITLGAEDAAGPWGQPDGAGCGNELVKAAYQAVGVTVDLKVMPYARAKKMAMVGEIDGCFCMSWDDSLKGNIVLADAPLYTVRSVIFARRKDRDRLRRLSDLPAGARIGIVTGYEYSSEISALSDRGIIFDPAPTEELMLRKLEAGRDLAAVANLDDLKSESWLLARAGTEETVGNAFVASSQGSYVGFSTRHPDGTEAKRLFDKGYAMILKNGTAKAIIKRWREQIAREIRKQP
jgi:polar amino acid transport system substrate-binding protein